MRTPVTLALVFSLLCGCVGLTAPERRILTYKQYAEISHEVPYILEFRTAEGALLLYGVRHVFDPKDAQIADIAAKWQRFEPTTALNEGGNPPTERSVQSAVERWGESGLVRVLAAWDRVPVATFEPSRLDETKDLLKKYSAEQVKVFLALRSFLTFRKSNNDKSPAEFMDHVLGDRNGLQNQPNNARELDISYRKLFPGLGAWHEVPENWFDPADTVQYTNEAQNDSLLFRDQHIFKVLIQRVEQGERVFAVIGASHVPVLEPALVSALGKPISKQNGFDEGS